MKTKSHYDSPLGGITLITDETALLGLWFDWQPGYADDDSAVLGDSPTIGAAKRWLDEYFAGCIPRTEVPLRLEGTPFRKEAWALLRKVPYGETDGCGLRIYRPDLAIHPLTASAALLALFCASVPMTASPGFTVVLVIAVIRSGVRPSPLPPCVQNG